MSRFTNSPCRKCKHYHYKDVLLGTCVHHPPYELANCNCTEEDYVPEDNLEYLEWCYERQTKQVS